ncbi:MAG: helix-turn-helix domain-containing protein [Deltaproteobacteria bacterium]|nr:MAG: helix-turn-helix domain-containing protein [Deltaproteobacteria bacterium]
MSKKLKGRALSKFESERDVWQEVLDGVREIKSGGGKRSVVEPRSPIVRARLKAGLTQEQFAALLGVSRRTLEQWEQGRRKPSQAAKTLIKVAELYPEVLREIAA